MSDKPDERDNPYEPVDGEEPADGTPQPAPAAPTDGDVPPGRTAPPAGTAGPTAARVDDDAVTSTYDVRQAERSRPVPAPEEEQPTLSEHRSAAYLTGERAPEPARTPDPREDAADRRRSPEEEAARGMPVGASGDGTEPRDRSDRDVLLEGTTALTRPPARTGSHVLTVLLTLLLTPVAWYLLADAGARFTLARANPWATGNLNPAALLELLGGLVVLAVVLLAARWSSLGATVTGVLVLVAGVPFVAAPAWTQETLEPALTWLAGRGDLGGNVAHHLVASGSTGRLVVSGVALVLVGTVSHGARRRGRREVRPVAAVA